MMCRGHPVHGPYLGLETEQPACTGKEDRPEDYSKYYVDGLQWQPCNSLLDSHSGIQSQSGGVTVSE